MFLKHLEHYCLQWCPNQCRVLVGRRMTSCAHPPWRSRTSPTARCQFAAQASLWLVFWKYESLGGATITVESKTLTIPIKMGWGTPMQTFYVRFIKSCHSCKGSTVLIVGYLLKAVLKFWLGSVSLPLQPFIQQRRTYFCCYHSPFLQQLRIVVWQ